MIVDASVLLGAFFPDEAQPQAQTLVREHIAGRIHLRAPQLLVYEFSNAVWQAERRGRITCQQAENLLEAVSGLNIELTGTDWGEMLPLARQHNLSAYDAAYLYQAQQTGEPLVTADERLLTAAGTHPGLLIRVGDYRA